MGPTAAVRAAVYARDRCTCAGCGEPVPGRSYSVRRRSVRRAAEGAPEAGDLTDWVLLCGSAASRDGCYQACEDRDERMHARGLWLNGWEDPVLVPIGYASPAPWSASSAARSRTA
jgi:5-methylcytosine-specific restriction endonuclease McrA